MVELVASLEIAPVGRAYLAFVKARLAKAGSGAAKGPRKSGEKERKSVKFLLPDAVEDVIDDDHYHNLGLRELTFNASDQHIKDAYRQALLKYHPDKAKDDDDSGNLRKLFDAAQVAYDVLGDSHRRRQYDSTFDFDESIPTGDEPDFFAAFGAAFARNARFSEVKPVPALGDDSTPDEAVEEFYRFWHAFKSWRDFTGEGEHNPEDADTREERRWMMRQNATVAKKRKKQEMARIIRLVERAEGSDPRIRRIRERQAEERKKRKAAEREQRRKDREERLAAAAKQHAPSAAQESAADAQRRAREEAQRMFDAFAEQYRATAARCKKTSKFLIADDLLRSLREDVSRGHVEQLDGILAKAPKPGLALKTVWTYAQEQFPKFADACRVQGSVDWTEEELAALQKALRKFPGGTRRRWLVVSQMVSAAVNRPISEEACAARVKAMRTQTQQAAAKEIVNRVKSNAAAAAAAPSPASSAPPTPTEDSWTVEQQSALEAALRKFPPSMDKNERWAKIAADVPGKSKKDCVKRFKELRAQIMKK